MKPTGNPHSMPMPSNAPWKSESMPWSVTPAMQSGVMQFSAPNLVSDPFYRRSLNHHKRKSEIIPPLPNKQYISEDKITAHFSGMHISSNFTRHSGPSGSSGTMEYDANNPITQKELEEKLKNANRITVCEEIRKMHSAHSSFMPNALLNRIERPCTALVLWQPPPKLEDLARRHRGANNNSIDTDEDDEEEPLDQEDNNNTTNRDMNNADAASTDGMDTDL